MSVKELKFEGANYDMYIETDKDGDISIQIDYKKMTLDRNQADLLRLYLTEHLK